MCKGKVLHIFELCCPSVGKWETKRLLRTQCFPGALTPHCKSRNTIRWPNEHSCQQALSPELTLLTVFHDRVHTVIYMMIMFKIISWFPVFSSILKKSLNVRAHILSCTLQKTPLTLKLCPEDRCLITSLQILKGGSLVFLFVSWHRRTQTGFLPFIVQFCV